MSDETNGKKRARKMPDKAIVHMMALIETQEAAEAATAESFDLIRDTMGIADDWTWHASEWMFRPPVDASNDQASSE